MPDLAPKPSAEEFAQIARAIAPGAEAISTRQLLGGISCRMDVLVFTPVHGQTRSVVVRQYGPHHLDDDIHPKTLESAVLQLLRENEVPAPELILGDEASEILGRPAIVTSLIDGIPKLIASDLTDWSGQLVSAIARVHSLAVPAKTRKLIPSLYAGAERSFLRSEPSENIARHPLGKELWQVLKKLWPEVDRSASCLVHADYWPGNTLWNDDRLVAIIDWEEPRLGEPTFDVAVIVQDAACFGMDIEEAVLARHAQISDRPLRDYDFWRMFLAMGEMPDPGDWAEGYMALGGEKITPDEVRAYHTATVEKMLGDF